MQRKTIVTKSELNGADEMATVDKVHRQMTVEWVSTHTYTFSSQTFHKWSNIYAMNLWTFTRKIKIKFFDGLQCTQRVVISK